MMSIGVLMSTNVSLAWGDHINLTYSELVAKVTDLHDVEQIEGNNPDLNLTRVLYPRFGYCLEVKNYPLHKVIINLWSGHNNDIYIYFTDKSLKTDFGIHHSSQTGNVIILDASKSLMNSFTVDISIVDSSYSADEDSCENSKKYKFTECVDEEVNKDLIPKFGCVPGWLSGRKPCATITKINFLSYFVDSYVVPYYYLLMTKAQSLCMLPCITQVMIYSLNISWG